VSTPEPGTSWSRQAPETTGERRLTGWQRAVRWVLWLTFLGVAIWKSQKVGFGALEFAALAAAVAFSIWCMAKPLGGPKVKLTKASHLLGTFESRTSWAMLLIGTLLTIGGIAGAGAAIYDMATGRASFVDVLRDIAIFIEGWIVEMFVPTYDAELEKTHAYALFLLIVPGLIMLAVNVTPLLKRGNAFRVEADGSVLVRRRMSWDPLPEYQYTTVVADGATIAFTAAAGGPPAVTLPQARVFCQENGARLKPALSADFFAGLLTTRGFAVERTDGSSHFSAQRK
jgi:hypothetical protein